jgi:hypothetical protein
MKKINVTIALIMLVPIFCFSQQKTDGVNNARLKFPILAVYYQTYLVHKQTTLALPTEKFYKHASIMHVWGGAFTVNKGNDTSNSPVDGATNVTWKKMIKEIKKVQRSGTKLICPIFTNAGWNRGEPTFEDYDPGKPGNKYYDPNYKDKPPAQKIHDFVTHLRQRYTDELGIDGLSIDAEARVRLATDFYLAVVDSISKYWGPKSGSKRLLSIVSNNRYREYEQVIKARPDNFDWVELMGYGGSFHATVKDNIALFNEVAAIYPKEKILMGLYNDGANGKNDFANSIDDALELTNWEPADGKKGGIMIFASDDNADINFTKKVIEAWEKKNKK